MKRILFLIGLSLVAVTAAVASDAPTKLDVAVSITSGNKVIATESATVNDREMHVFEGAAKSDRPTYHVEVTPGLMPDLPNQAIVRSLIRVNSISEHKTTQAKNMPAIPMSETGSCLTSATSRIKLGKPTQVLMVLNGSQLPPGCGLRVTVTKIAPAAH